MGEFNASSRGDTQEYADLNKLAKRFLKGSHNELEDEAKDMPSRAYVQEVVEELRKGEQGECPICLEVFDDAVLTPCAHRLCRECLLASWRTPTSGLCPVCRCDLVASSTLTFIMLPFLSFPLFLLFCTRWSFFIMNFSGHTFSDIMISPYCRKAINRQDLITAPTDSRFTVDVEKNWVESSKIVVLLQELENLRKSGSKSIIFSQWTAFLDLLQIPLSR